MASSLNYWDRMTGRGEVQSPSSIFPLTPAQETARMRGKIWIWLSPSETHLFSRKNPRIRWIFPLFIFPNRFPPPLCCKIDFYLQNVFMGMRAFQWKHYKSPTNPRHLWEERGCFSKTHFSWRAVAPAIFLHFQFCNVLVCSELGCVNSRWVCASFVKLTRCEEKVPWQLMGARTAEEACLNGSPDSNAISVLQLQGSGLSSARPYFNEILQLSTHWLLLECCGRESRKPRTQTVLLTLAPNKLPVYLAQELHSSSFPPRSQVLEHSL